MRYAGNVRFGDTTAPTHPLEVTGPMVDTQGLIQLYPTGTYASVGGQTFGVLDNTGITLNATLAQYGSYTTRGTVTDSTAVSAGIFTTFRNQTTVDRTAGTVNTGIVSFDSLPIIRINADIDVTSGTTAGFQHQSTYSVNGAGTPTLVGQIDNGFTVNAITIGANTTIATQRGFYMKDATGAGTLTTAVGLDIESLTKAGTAMSFRSAGAQTMRHEGSVGIGVLVANAPAARLEVQEPTVGNEVVRIDSIATNDDPTEQTFQCRVATTDATVTDCKTVAVTSTKVRTMMATVVAHCTGGVSCATNNGAEYTIVGTCKNDGGTTGAVTGSPDVIAASEDVAGWDATIDCDNTGDTIRLRVTGAATTNITWHATIRTMEVGT
jgi:hypothetical protein